MAGHAHLRGILWPVRGYGAVRTGSRGGVAVGFGAAVGVGASHHRTPFMGALRVLRYRTAASGASRCGALR
jgi:hypothetical protein